MHHIMQAAYHSQPLNVQPKMALFSRRVAPTWQKVGLFTKLSTSLDFLSRLVFTFLKGGGGWGGLVQIFFTLRPPTPSPPLRRVMGFSIFFCSNFKSF